MKLLVSAGPLFDDSGWMRVLDGVDAAGVEVLGRQGGDGRRAGIGATDDGAGNDDFFAGQFIHLAGILDRGGRLGLRRDRLLCHGRRSECERRSRSKQKRLRRERNAGHMIPRLARTSDFAVRLAQLPPPFAVPQRDAQRASSGNAAHVGNCKDAHD